MKVYWNIFIEKATGDRLVYSYKDSWGQRYYSFDEERSWHRSRVDAYLAARSAGALQYLQLTERQAALTAWEVQCD